ncbi:hypothetical protein GGR10_000513 [Bartonella chomelii]|uniref:Uncharacterized protein n=1 Tax=Bartonella chomelii TaxID=236402 RepID=A0ABR6E275_9HYPH|nr:hypothetical protein [Bartonella chomelii]
MPHTNDLPLKQRSFPTRMPLLNSLSQTISLPPFKTTLPFPNFNTSSSPQTTPLHLLATTPPHLPATMPPHPSDTTLPHPVRPSSLKATPFSSTKPHPITHKGQ